MENLEKARKAVSDLQHELTRRRDRKLRELFCDEAVALTNRVALHLKYAEDQGGSAVLFERAGQGLTNLFSKLNSTKQQEEFREMKVSLVNISKIVSELNNIAQSGIFVCPDVAYETIKVKRFVEKMIRGLEMYTSDNPD